jgi:WD40 repeat protein
MRSGLKVLCCFLLVVSRCLAQELYDDGQVLITAENEAFESAAPQIPSLVYLAACAVREVLDGGVELLNFKQDETAFKGHKHYVKAVAFFPDGRYFVTASMDETARIWDRREKDCLVVLAGHTAFIDSVAVSPDGARIATASNDGTVCIWNRLGSCLARAPLKHWVTSVAFASDGTSVLAAVSGQLYLFDVNTANVICTFQGHTDTIKSIAAFSNNFFVSGSDDKTARVWNGLGECLAILSHENCVSAVAASSEGMFIATGDSDGRVRVWDLSSGDARLFRDFKPYVQRESPIATIKSIDFSPDSSTIMVSSFEKNVVIIDIYSSTLVQELLFKYDPIHDARFSKDGTSIIVGYSSWQPSLFYREQEESFWDMLTNFSKLSIKEKCDIQ